MEVYGFQRRRLIAYPDQLLERLTIGWLNNDDPNHFGYSGRTADAFVGKGSLTLRRSYIDVTKPTRKAHALGCLAVKLNRVVILSRQFKDEDYYLRDMAELHGFRVIEVPNLLALRATFTSSIPNARLWKKAVAATVKSMDNPTDIDALQRQIEFTNRETIDRARMENAFRYRGMMTHVITRDPFKTSDGDGDRDPPAFDEFFPDAETALAAFLAKENTERYAVVEFLS